MRISQEHYDAMVEHARADLPDECCGLVICEGDDVVGVHPVRNIQRSSVSFLMDPVQVVEVFDRVQEGQRVGALYHSHPSLLPVPSMIDVGDAKDWSGMMWIIIGNLEHRRYRRWRARFDDWDDELDVWEPDVWAWWIEERRVFTAELTVEGGHADKAGPLAIQTEGRP